MHETRAETKANTCLVKIRAHHSVKNLGNSNISVMVHEVLPRSKHRFDLRPETRQVHK